MCGTIGAFGLSWIFWQSSSDIQIRPYCFEDILGVRMKALTYERYGGPDVVRIEDVEAPTPGENEVLIRVHASAVNTGDWRIRAAAFPGVLAIPGRFMFGLLRPRNRRLGSEFAGVVERAGTSANQFKVGDRVFGMLTTGGASAEYLAMPETGAIAQMPAALTFEEAAGMPFGGLCALVFLGEFAKLKPGQKVLIVGASGGVGAYAVQIAKALGAHVTGVAGSNNQEFVASLGAEETIDYRKTDLATLERGFDVVFDTFGGTSPKVSRSLLVDGGLFLPLNFGLREIGAALVNRFRSRKIRLAVNEDRREDMVRLAELVEAGELRPVIDSVYPLEEAADAHTQVESRHKRGAVVLKIGSASE
ncbi:MAG: NAD(P)-dependent alcohol dehydrogenase [Planctomycetota bacterium]|jgi:NADPH:quinone reductase-like Zn-dependent oxidoreductase